MPDPKLARRDLRQRRLAKARWSVEQYVVKGFGARLGGGATDARAGCRVVSLLAVPVFAFPDDEGDGEGSGAEGPQAEVLRVASERGYFVDDRLHAPPPTTPGADVLPSPPRRM